jgi:hypothetical protein
MKTERPIPSEGDWFKRSNKTTGISARYAERPTDTVRIGKVDKERQEFEVQRIDGITAHGEVIVGRRTKVSFETWADEGGRRYEPCDPPTPPIVDEPAPESGVKAATTATIEERIAAIDARQRGMDSKLDEILALARGRGNGGGQLPLPAVSR